VPADAQQARTRCSFLPCLQRLSNVFVIGDGSKPAISMPKGGGVHLSIAEERDQRRRQKEAQSA
jgi:hypothetical protein